EAPTCRDGNHGKLLPLHACRFCHSFSGLRRKFFGGDKGEAVGLNLFSVFPSFVNVSRTFLYTAPPVFRRSTSANSEDPLGEGAICKACKIYCSARVRPSSRLRSPAIRKSS